MIRVGTLVRCKTFGGLALAKNPDELTNRRAAVGVAKHGDIALVIDKDEFSESRGWEPDNQYVAICVLGTWGVGWAWLSSWELV